MANDKTNDMVHYMANDMITPATTTATLEQYEALHQEIHRLLQLEIQSNPVTYNTTLPYQSYDRINFKGLRWTPEKRIKEYGLLHYTNNAVVLDIGSNMGFLTVELALQGARHSVGIEPQPYLVQIGMATAQALGMDGKTSFHDVSFENFMPSFSFDVVLSFAAFHTADGRERQNAEAYFGKIWQLLQDRGYVVFESVSYNLLERGEHWQSNQEALRYLREHFEIVIDESRPSGSKNWFRDFFVGRKKGAVSSVSLQASVNGGKT